MYAFDITKTEHSFSFQNDAKNPSFSATLLDKIYRSIDEGEKKTNDMKFHNETMGKKQSRVMEEELTAASIRRACLLEKWKGREKTVKTQMERKSCWRNHDHHKEVMFFSSTSSSSDSSSGLLSSPDAESLYGMRSKPRVSCFAPSRGKPVMTSAGNEEVNLIKSKSRALKIYNNLKKVKQPISPGGKLSSFLNSLFATGNANKTKTKTKTNDNAKPKSVQDSTCSSASSFSRSCLSKASPSSNKLRDGVKRTVRFYPVSVIVDEDCRPCGHKCLYEEDTRVMAVSVPTAWKIGRKKNEEEEEEKVVDKSRRVEEAAREFLKEYHQSQKKSDSILSDFPNEDEEDDDAASYSSSDLFELDHLAVMGNHRYSEELPVFETTYVSTNRAIANGLI